MSIRLRLTLLYSAILALTLILSGLVVYRVAADAMLDAGKARLVGDTSTLADVLHRYPIDLSAPPSLSLADTYYQIRSLDGSVLTAPKGPGAALPLDAATLAQLQNPGPPPTPRIVMVGNQPFLVYATRMAMFRDQFAAILQVGRPLAVIYQPLDRVRQVLLAGSAVMTLLACVAGWFLAGVALRPVNRITQTAQAIGESRDFDRRVTYRGPRDEIGRLAMTFNTMLARLGEAYRAQQRFVADASHELRTPLTSIRGNLALLQRKPPISTEDREAVLSDLVHESERMKRLVDDLLTLARADAGRPPRRAPVLVAPLVSDLLRRLRPLHPDHALVNRIPDAVAVLGDRDALTQILLILLDNALKFTPPDGTITLSAAAGDGHVALSVQDTGPGIAPEALPHIFERFYQADPSRTGAGTGLGLAIAKMLVEAQGGTISVQSMPGQGSTFTVTLAQAIASDAPRPEPLRSAS